VGPGLPLFVILRDVAAERNAACRATYALCSAASSALAAGSEEAGFCPVMSRPSTTTGGCQSFALVKCAPCSLSMSSTGKGTTLVSPAAASSVFAWGEQIYAEPAQLAVRCHTWTPSGRNRCVASGRALLMGVDIAT
jgi:hypothetical protein